MILRLILHIIAGILGIFLSVKFVPGVGLLGPFESILIAGAILGLLNFFVKPILKILTWPLRILTLGLFSFVINIFLVWVVVDFLFSKDIKVAGLIPILWTTAIVWLTNLILGAFPRKKKK